MTPVEYAAEKILAPYVAANDLPAMRAKRDPHDGGPGFDLYVARWDNTKRWRIWLRPWHGDWQDPLGAFKTKREADAVVRILADHMGAAIYENGVQINV